ncbi:MAG: major capsid protein, partial [Anaerolineales bacterium]|nr:major capsid protein [Anaerolineales bacterium]
VCAPRNALPETTLYIPFQFWYCRNPGLALPLIALQYHEVKINLDIRPIDEVLWAVYTLNCGDSGKHSGSRKSLSRSNQGKVVKATTAYNQSLVAASLYVDYVFLDTDERRRMAQNPHEYLIEQLQFTGDESVGSSSNKIKLNFNHPCKELVFVVQPDQNVDYCASLECGELLFRTLGAQPFNYTDAIDALPNSIRAFSSSKQLNDGGNAGNTSVINTDGLFSDPNAGHSATAENMATTAVSELSGNLGSAGVTNGVSDAGAFVLAETSLKMHCWGENPVVTAKLQLNGQDRFSEREGTYFDLVQPFQHHTRTPDTGINVYSFALRPEEHQPSGTCNFSRIDNATLQLVVSAAAIGSANTAKVRVYATNYNVLRVMSGMGGLAYSN